MIRPARPTAAVGGADPIWRCAACRRAAVPRVVYAGNMRGLQAGRPAPPGAKRGRCVRLRATDRFGKGIKLVPGGPPCVPPSAWEDSPAVPCHRLNPAGWVDRPARPARPAGEEWAHAGSSHRRPPPPPHCDAPSGGRKHTGGEDQDQLCRPGLRGLGPPAMPVAARSAILVRPAYLSALDPPPVTAGCRGPAAGAGCRMSFVRLARPFMPASARPAVPPRTARCRLDRPRSAT